MKILLVSNLYPSKKYPFYGTFVKNFESQMVEKGVKFDHAVIKGKSRSAVRKVINYAIFFLKAFLKLVKSDCDIIYVHYINHSVIPLLLAQPLIRKPVILNAHGGDVLPSGWLSLFIQKLTSPLVKKSSLVVVPSSYFKYVVQKKFNILEEKVFISPSAGVNLSLFKPSPKVKDEVPFTIGYLSRVDVGKGWEIFLDSLYTLKRLGVPFKAIVVGGGAQYKKMILKINDLGLNNSIEVCGPQPHCKLPGFFNKMDLFVFPTRSAESLGLVGVEAMACGLPVVGSNIGGVAEYVKPGFNGEIFKLGDADDLSSKIMKFIGMEWSDFSLYKENALATAADFDSNLVADLLYRKVINFSPEP